MVNSEFERDYWKITSKRYRNKHKFRRRISCTKSQEKIRQRILSHYSGGLICCNTCKFNNPLALALDHIDNNGSKHKKIIGHRGGYSYYNWFIKNNFPEGYQVLCFNCNQIKEWINRKRDIRNEVCHNPFDKDVQWAVQEAKDLLRLIDKANGIDTIKGDFE